MKMLVAAVAEHAWVESGCLSICRAFDTITASSFPYTFPRLSIALRLLVRRAEVGEHKLTVMLADEDGKKLLKADIKMNVQQPQKSVPESSFSFALNGQSIVFPKPGDYVVDILVDNRAEASIPIYVRKK